jgi:hypothetical protein
MMMGFHMCWIMIVRHACGPYNAHSMDGQVGNRHRCERMQTDMSAHLHCTPTTCDCYQRIFKCSCAAAKVTLPLVETANLTSLQELRRPAFAAALAQEGFTHACTNTKHPLPSISAQELCYNHVRCSRENTHTEMGIGSCHRPPIMCSHPLCYQTRHTAWPLATQAEAAHQWWCGSTMVMRPRPPSTSTMR